MAIDPQSLAVGKCYKTIYDHNRRISQIDGDIITYESWGGSKGTHKGHLDQCIISRATFLKALERELDCAKAMHA